MNTETDIRLNLKGRINLQLLFLFFVIFFTVLFIPVSAFFPNLQSEKSLWPLIAWETFSSILIRWLIILGTANVFLGVLSAVWAFRKSRSVQYKSEMLGLFLRVYNLFIAGLPIIGLFILETGPLAKSRSEMEKRYHQVLERERTNELFILIGRQHRD